MKKIAAFVTSRNTAVTRNVYLTFREVSFTGELAELLDAAHAKSNPSPHDPETPVARPFDFPENPATPIPMTKEISEGVAFTSTTAFRDELAGSPEAEERIHDNRQVRLSAVLPDAEIQKVIRRLAQKRGIDLISLPSVMTFSGQPALSRLGHRRCGATAALSADNSQVELDLYRPETGEALLEKDAILRPTIRTTIPTGHTAVVAVKRPDGANRLVLVQAQIFEDPVAPVPEVVPNESVPKAE